MHLIEIATKIGSSNRAFFQTEGDAKAAYDKIKNAVEGHEPFRNQRQDCVSIALDGDAGEVTLVIDTIIGVTICRCDDEAFARASLEATKRMIDLKKEILGPSPESEDTTA